MKLVPKEQSLVVAYVDTTAYASGNGAITPPYALLASFLGVLLTAFGVPAALGIVDSPNQWIGAAIFTTGIAVTISGVLAFRRTTALKNSLGFGGSLHPTSIHARALSPTIPAVLSPGPIVFRWPRPLGPLAVAAGPILVAVLVAINGHGIDRVAIPVVFVIPAILILQRTRQTCVTIDEEGITDQGVVLVRHFRWDEVSGARTPEAQLGSADGSYPLVLVDRNGVAHGLVPSFGGEQRPAPPGHPSSRQARILIAADVIRTRATGR